MLSQEKEERGQEDVTGKFLLGLKNYNITNKMLVV